VPLCATLTRCVSVWPSGITWLVTIQSTWQRLLVGTCAGLVPLSIAHAQLQAARTSPATGAASLSGTWSASPLKESWSFPAWPEACGPKPPSNGAPGGISEVVEQGGELSFAGAGKAYKTSNCWDQSTGIRRVTHAQNARSWSNTCKTLSSDARQVDLHTSVSASDSRITFRETGHYIYRQGGATCEADVTRSRTYSRVTADHLGSDTRRSSGAASLTPALAAPPDETTLTQQAVAARLAPNECPNPGLPSDVRFVHVVPWVEPGGSAQLSAQAVDKDGCATRGTMLYPVEPATPTLAIGERTGLLRVAATAEQGTISVIARSGSLSKAVAIPIVSKASRSALLQAPGDQPIQTNAASQAVADSIIGSSTTRAQDGATERKWWFAGFAGLVVVGLATLGLRLLRAGSRSVNERVEPPPFVPGPGAADGPIGSRRPGRMSTDPSITKGEIVVTDVGKTDPGRRRPEVFTYSATTDSEPSITQSKRNSGPFGKRESSCPRCGTRYIDGSLYCGVDGERLR
jgi:hypothetical protein